MGSLIKEYSLQKPTLSKKSIANELYSDKEITTYVIENKRKYERIILL